MHFVPGINKILLLYGRVVRGDAPRSMPNKRSCRSCLRILGIEEIKSVPFGPQSHPFVEGLIGTLRRDSFGMEYKLVAYCDYYNEHRCHTGLSGATPNGYETEQAASPVIFRSGMFYLPVAR